MSDPYMIDKIIEAVSVPVMAKARIGHFVEAQVLQSLGMDYIDESEVLTRPTTSTTSTSGTSRFPSCAVPPTSVRPCAVLFLCGPSVVPSGTTDGGAGVTYQHLYKRATAVPTEFGPRPTIWKCHRHLVLGRSWDRVKYQPHGRSHQLTVSDQASDAPNGGGSLSSFT